MLPVREERHLILLPAGFTGPEASALPVNLPNLRLNCKGDLPALKERRGP